MDILSAPGRKYPVLNSSEEVCITGRDSSLTETAQKYVPHFYLHETLDYMRPVRTLYEAVSTKEALLLNYYVHWKDEIHPNPVFHRLYRGFRSIVYGSPADIEYVQVGVSYETGAVVRLAFEKDPSERPDAPAPKHDVIICRRSSENDPFTISVNGKKTDKADVVFKDNRPAILVATWNHIYDFYTGEGVLMDDPPLKFMTEDLYVKYYMHRRSRPPL
ncbi:hypothetical protein ACFLQK_00880 [bacterium]